MQCLVCLVCLVCCFLNRLLSICSMPDKFHTMVLDHRSHLSLESKLKSLKTFLKLNAVWFNRSDSNWKLKTIAFEKLIWKLSRVYLENIQTEIETKRNCLQSLKFTKLFTPFSESRSRESIFIACLLSICIISGAHWVHWILFNK